MPHPVWPLFDLRVHTPRLELRYPDDEMVSALALLAAQGIHDPSTMPFTFPWTDVESPLLERNTMKWFWKRRVDVDANHWGLPFAVIVDGAVVGVTELLADDFPVMRQFETGSWLGLAHQSKGLGKEMRSATLHLGFAGLGAEFALTAAWDDNPASRGVTHSLGYTEIGRIRNIRREEPATTVHYSMTRAHWEQTLRRDDIVIEGLEPCLELLGLTPRHS